MQRKSIAIVNPIAGSAHCGSIELSLRKWFERHAVSCDIALTEYRGHGSIISIDALQKGFNHFIVVGGDGTVNEVATELMNHPEVSMGIVPRGSGNGLSYHLKLPIKTEQALETAFGLKTIRSDVGVLNQKPFFSVAGVGFDAMIAYKFSQMKGRGLKNYIKAVLQNYSSYKPSRYEINVNGNQFFTNALMISFANSNQFGNNTSLSPDSSLTDGQIEICIMKKPTIPSAIILSPLFFLKKINKTRFLQIVKARNANIKVTRPAFIHLDGDPYQLDVDEIRLDTIPGAINIHVN